MGRLPSIPGGSICPAYPGTGKSEDRLWCGRWESNPHEPKPCGFSYHFGFRRPRHDGGFVVWTIPSPDAGFDRHLRRRPSSLYTFPERASIRAWLGIAISGFPDFGQFCIAGFPAGTQVLLSPLRMPFRHARAAGHFLKSIIKQAGEIYTSVSEAGCCGAPCAGFFFFFGHMRLISTASRFGLMCTLACGLVEFFIFLGG
jgi:hypothetical protein